MRCLVGNYTIKMEKMEKELWFVLVYVVCLLIIFLSLIQIFDWGIGNYLYWIHLIVVLIFQLIGIRFIKSFWGGEDDI